MLLVTATVFVVGNLVSALGPTYGIIMAGRIISAMAHGAFLGIAAVFAAELVSNEMKGRAIATVFTGLTAATVLGAPIGAAIGRTFGWRATFWSLVLMGAVTLIGLLILLPRRAKHNGSAHAASADAGHGERGHHVRHDAHGGGHDEFAHRPDTEGAHVIANEDLTGLDAHALAHMGGAGGAAQLREQLRALRRRSVWVSLVTTLLSYGGVFTSYVYLAPQLTDVAGFDAAWITPLFLLFGIGLFVGNLIGGKLADRHLLPSVVGTVGGLVLILFLMTVAIQHPITAIVGLVFYGVAAFAVVAPLQLRVMHEAGDAPDVASAANISAFTLGSALGIWLGGAAIDAGLGLTAVNWVGGLISLSGLILALGSWWSLHRAAPAGDVGHHVGHGPVGQH